MGSECGTCAGEQRGSQCVSAGKPEKKRQFRRTSRTWGQVAGACEYGNELSGSIKCGEFLD